MGSPTANNRRTSSNPSEQSLLRSFSAIRRHSSVPATNDSSGQGYVSRDRSEQNRKFRRRSKALQRKIILPDDQQGRRSPTGIATGPANEPVVPEYEIGTRVCQKGQKGSAGALTTSNVDLQALPFPDSSVEKESQHKGLRLDYQLGETLRTPSHMIVKPTDDQVCQAAGALDNHDFAFVKRSDGSFSYAILAYRSVEPVKRGDKKSVEDCMTFVVNGAGSTKKVCRRQWAKCVRLVSMDGFAGHPPIDVILFDPQMSDEYSVVSNVSDRSRPSR